MYIQIHEKNDMYIYIMYYKNVCVRAPENAVHNKSAMVDHNQICICSRCPNSIQTDIYNKMIVLCIPSVFYGVLARV